MHPVRLRTCHGPTARPCRRTRRFRPSVPLASPRLHHNPPRAAGVARLPVCPPECAIFAPRRPLTLARCTRWAIRPGPPPQHHRTSSSRLPSCPTLSGFSLLPSLHAMGRCAASSALTLAALLIRASNPTAAPALISSLHSHLLDHKPCHDMTTYHYPATTI